MPLIKPEIQKVLRAAGLKTPLGSEPLEDSDAESSFSAKLDQAGLSSDELAIELVHLAKNSGNETLRLRAIETALKIKGALRENILPVIPSFTINIQPLQESKTAQQNIFFPRPVPPPPASLAANKEKDKTN